MINFSQSNGISKAKPLIYLMMLLGAWVVARIIFTLSTTHANDADIKLIRSPLANAEQISNQNLQPKNIKIGQISAEQSEARQTELGKDASSYDFATQFLDVSKDIHIPSAASYITATSNGLPKSYYPLLFLGAIEERSNSLIRPNQYAGVGWNLPPGNGNKLIQLSPNNQNDNRENSNLASRLSGYAYIFARKNSGDANALGGRYGGSQAAVQLAYRINPKQGTVFDATLRAQSALSDSDREIAAGVRFKPNEKFPLAIVAERRFRPSNPDGYALYVAGGKSKIPLPANFKLNAYGQAGVSTAGRDTLFFDGQIIAEKSVHKNNSVEILAGGGAWAGGQRGAQRIDIGPSVSIKLSTGKKNYRISGDWRERIGGDASPNSGAAITLSTDF